MSVLAPSKVKQGFWIDYSHGQVLGSTITTDTTTANVVVSILAVVVSLASVHLWRLLLFSFYQFRTNKGIGDVLFRQQQAILRNVSGPEQTLWDFCKLGLIWRGKAKNSAIRSFGPALVALIFSAIALAASLASSFIISTGNITVLVNNHHCGFFESFQGLSYQNAILMSALDYAENCYLHDTASGLCVKYVRPRINFTTTPAPCPFSSSMCIDTQGNSGSASQKTPGITMDTGYIDSNNDFGLNAAPEDRVQLRKRTTCAPIKVSGYYTVIDAAGHPTGTGRKPFPGQQYFRLQYGILPGYQGKFLHNYLYDSYKSNYTLTYSLEATQSGPSYGRFGTLEPIEPLVRSDADTILIWVFNNAVQNQHKVDDPVFSAHEKKYKLLENRGGRQNITVFNPDNPFGAVACAEQYQFCITNTNTNTLNCTDLGGLPTSHETAPLGLNKNQKATFAALRVAMSDTDISVAAFNNGALLASRTVNNIGTQDAHIPDNQWKREVNLWESYALSAIQGFVTGHALGPGVGSAGQIITPPTDAGKQLCKAQKMVIQGGFANISVFGLAFTLAMSGIIVIADLLILRVLVFLNKSNKFWGFKVDRWVQDGVLQLQRKAYEGAGQGIWSRRNRDMPVARPNDQLHDLDSDLESEDRQYSSWTDGTIVLDSASRQPSHALSEKSTQNQDTETQTAQPMDSVGDVSAGSSRTETDAEATAPADVQATFPTDTDVKL